MSFFSVVFIKLVLIGIILNCEEFCPHRFILLKSKAGLYNAKRSKYNLKIRYCDFCGKKGFLVKTSISEFIRGENN